MVKATKARKLRGPRGALSIAALLFGLLGGAGAWLLYLSFAALLAEGGCGPYPTEPAVLGLGKTSFLLLAIGLLALGVACAATWVALRALRREREKPEQERSAVTRYLAFAGLITSGSFVFVIVVQTLPLLFFPRC
jgi:hypothetical protein